MARPLAGSAQFARKARTRGAAISVSTARPGGAFLSSLFENWESEFLQMRTYVVLTAYLMQRGSPESKDLDEPSPQDRDPVLDADRKDATDCLQRAHRGARVRSPGRRRLRRASRPARSPLRRESPARRTVRQKGPAFLNGDDGCQETRPERCAPRRTGFGPP